MRRGFRVWDTHTHLGDALHSGRSMTPESLLRLMDREGIERALAIPFPVVEDHRVAHDVIARACNSWPDRFTGCACIHPYVPRPTFGDELRRCVEELGFKALKLQPQYHGLNPISRRNEFFFEAACAWKLPIVVHTGAGAPFALPSLYISVARRFPELPVILGHAGGGLYVAECIVAAEVCPNIFVELSSLQPHHVSEVLAHVSSDRLMIGSDLPESTAAEIDKIIGLEVGESTKQDILWNTASKLFEGDH